MSRQGGFTTVELLVTLFVAALFIASGYQLYNVITMRSGNARMMSEASNIGYDVLRKEGATVAGVPVSCSNPVNTHPTQSVSRTSETLPGLTIRIIRCTPASDLSVVRVSVIVSCGSPVKEVTHATYVAR